MSYYVMHFIFVHNYVMIQALLVHDTLSGVQRQTQRRRLEGFLSPKADAI